VTTLTWLGVPGDADAWRTLGFEVADSIVQIGQVSCGLGGSRGWGFSRLGADPAPLGVATVVWPQPQTLVGHPCGVTQVDHVVYTVPDLDAGIAALNSALDSEPRRRFHPRGPSGPEMAFYRVGEAFIEVVASGTEPALIGLALKSPDLDATVAAIRSRGGPTSDPKPAVQGGRISSVWHGYLGWGLAIMGP
jgi:hypothetical protein